MTTSRSVTFEAGKDEAHLLFVAGDFSTDVTESGDLTASVGTVSGYDVTDGEVTVSVISQEGPAVTVTFDEDSYEFDEDDGDDDITLVARAAAGVPFVAPFQVAVSTEAIEATGGMVGTNIGDYVHFLENVSIDTSDFDEVADRLVAQVDVSIAIKDDQIYEGDETFGINFGISPGVSGEVELIGPDGRACNMICGKLFVITIKDDEPLPAVKLSHTMLTVEEGDTGTYSAVLITQPTDDVTITPTGVGLTFGPASHTFTTEKWATVHEFDVSPQEDDDKLDNLVIISHEVSGGGYDDATVPTLTIAVTDNDKTVPSAPLNLSATPGSLVVQLSWDAPADDGGQDISLYEYKVGSDNWTSTGSADTEYIVPSLMNGTAYDF